MISIWIKYVYAPFINRVGKRVLTGRLRSPNRAEMGRFTRKDSRKILTDVWSRFDDLSQSLPSEPNLGGRINVNLACLTLCCFQSLLAAGVDRQYAIELISDLTWNLYRVWGTVVKYIVWISKVSRTDRLKLAVRSFLRFPFSPPTYQIERIPNAKGIDLNVTRCPVSEYFRSENATDLCTESWCNLDFALAEMWDGHLERTKTLALGNDHCNFKFTANTNEP